MYKLTNKKRLAIELEVRFEYSRSSGPGGQKVNKTETQVAVRFPLMASTVFNDEQKQRISQKLSNRINKEGEILFQSDKFRTRPQNQKHCFQNLCSMIEQALTREKVRKKTRPTRSSVEKRIQEKKKQGEKKKNRQKF